MIIYLYIFHTKSFVYKILLSNGKCDLKTKKPGARLTVCSSTNLY